MFLGSKIQVFIALDSLQPRHHRQCATAAILYDQFGRPAGSAYQYRNSYFFFDQFGRPADSAYATATASSALPAFTGTRTIKQNMMISQLANFYCARTPARKGPDTSCTVGKRGVSRFSLGETRS